MEEYNDSLGKINKKYAIKKRRSDGIRKYHLLSLETKCLSTITKAQVKYTFFQKKFHYVLSRERVTCFTQLSSDPKIELKSEFVFKDKATQAHLTPPKDV